MNDLYFEKIAILKEVLKLTQSIEFKGNEDDADKYIDLIEKREELFDRAKEIDKRLNPAENMPEPEEYTREVAALAKQIIEQDNYMNEAVLRIHDESKADIRNINTGKNLSNLYGNTVPDPEMTGRDWSQ